VFSGLFCSLLYLYIIISSYIVSSVEVKERLVGEFASKTEASVSHKEEAPISNLSVTSTSLRMEDCLRMPPG
jgi:hypothetical protein